MSFTTNITYNLIPVYDGSGRLYFSSRTPGIMIPSYPERMGILVSGIDLFNYLADADPNKVDFKSLYNFTWSPLYPMTGYRLSNPLYVDYFNGTETKSLAITDINNSHGHTCLLFPDAFDNWVNDGKVLREGYAAPADGYDVVPTNATVEITSLPTAPDTESPVITLTGDAEITLNQGETYVEQGATWTDNVDGTGDATATGSVDTSVVGSYTITYSYTDAAGNAATEVTRAVNVVEPPVFAFSTTYNSGVTLTNNNTTAQTNTTNFRRAVSANAISSGVVSFEFTIDQIAEGIFLGIISEENPSSANEFVGASNNSYGIYGQPTLSYIWEYEPTAVLSSSRNNDAQLRLGDTVAFTFDADNGTLSYAVNGGTVYEITGVPSGTYYPVIGSGSATKKVTSTIAVGQDITVDVTPPTTATVIDPGSGYTSPGTDVPTTGGSGTGLKVSYDVGDDGGVVDPTITDDGTGYQDGDVVDIPGGTEPAKVVLTTYTAPPAGTDTNSILFKIGRAIKVAGVTGGVASIDGLLDVKTSGAGHTPSDGQALIWDESMGHWMPKDQTEGVSNFLALSDTPTTYSSNTPNLKLNDAGTGLEFVSNNYVVDGEFRGMMGNLLFHRPSLQINAGDEYDITDISRNSVIWRTPNNTIRYLRHSDEYGAGGNDYFIRIDGGEPTCDGGGDYDAETNSCFPNTQNVVAASTFQGVYDPNLASVASGSYPYSAKIRILKTGLYATGWIDVHQMYTDLNTAGANIASNDSDIANLQNDVATLQAGGGGGSAATYTKATLPLSGSSADLALVTDGTISGDPTMAYFYQGKWFRSLDNSEITDQTIDIFLLAGQSNAHGHAVVSDLDANQLTQDGLFYTSWHDNTSNASSTQYYSSWATSLVAGNTRGDNGSSTIGGSTMFGPEIGFVERANSINLTDGQPIGVLKHAIGASSLTDVGGSADLSDWDLTATGDKKGDALRAFKLAVADGLTKLTNAGYSYRLAGMIWWQGESGGADSDLIAFIDHIRTWLDDNSYLSMPKAQFPFVITGTTDYWGRTYEANVADQDGYVGFVNTQDIAAPAWADRTLVHPGSNEAYNTDSDDINNGYSGSVGDSVGGPDFNNDGVNDMFAIGRAYADQMDLAKTGNTNSLWTPDDIELWLDASDTNTTTFSGGNLVSIKDKNSNGSVGSNTFSATGNIVAGSENGLQTLTFEDDDTSSGTDHIQSSALATAMSANNQIWFFAIKPINIGTDGDGGASQYDGMFMVGAKTYLSKLGMFFENNQVLNTTPVLPNNEVSILAIQMNWATSGNNGTTSCWIDGTSVGTANQLQATGTNTPLSSTGTSDWKFMMYNNGQNYLEGEFCEFVATDNLSDRVKIEGYLAHKWGIENKLPSGHTYKSSAP